MGTTLRDQLFDVRIKNVEGKYFIPNKALEDVLSADKIRTCILCSSIEEIRRTDVLRVIESGGKRVFAILLLLGKESLMDNFVQNDHMLQGTNLDSKLPLHLETLETVLLDERVASEFCQRQWELLPPFFQEDRNHRTFESETVLPFIEQEELAQGGFGEVFKVTLDANQHAFSFGYGRKLQIVRKVIKYVDKDDDDSDVGDGSDNNDKGDAIVEHKSEDETFKSEERILCLLRSLKHSNIVKLLASFSTPNPAGGEIKYKHSLLFPLADNTLASILADHKINALSAYFESDQDLYQQLFGLGSAIESVHNYFSDEFDLKLIGCHYDLNPRNILVSKQKLLLADFGLSRLRPDHSGSRFDKGRGDYIAPECEPIVKGTFGKGIVGRASDIWSFGCVLIEVLTHKMFGGKGVKAFRAARKNKSLPFFVQYQFHAGGSEHPAVIHQLHVLEGRLDRSQRCLPRFIGEMLQIDPSKRPNASATTFRLFLQSQRTLANLIIEAFATLKESSTVLELAIEYERFQIWARSATFIDDDTTDLVVPSNNALSWIWNSKQQFDAIHTILKTLHSEVASLQAALHHSQAVVIKPLYRPLRELVDKLWFVLPIDTRRNLSRSLDSRMLGSDDFEILRKTSERFSTDPDYENLALLAAIKHMTRELDDDTSTKTRRLLRKEPVPIERSFGTHSLGSIIASPNASKQSVLIEWRAYSAHWESQQVRDEGYDRIEAIAELFNRPELQLGLHVLQCIGYYHELARHAFGLIYAFPQGLPGHAQPITLRHIIRTIHRPLLGEIFYLARSIVHCVVNLHKTKWLHKNISSYNIIFLNTGAPQREESPKKTQQPSLPQIPTPSPHRKQKPSFLKKHLTKALSSRSNERRENPSEILSVPNSLTSSSTSLMAAASTRELPFSKSASTKISSTLDLKSFYLIGFNYSRQNTPTALTQGPSTDPRQIHYQHPSYTLRASFRPRFDYYSIGLVLLEIGLWKCLTDLSNDNLDMLTPKEQQRLWLDRVVPRLGEFMGETYRDAVDWCLRYGTEGNGEAGDQDDVQREAIDHFEAYVASPMDYCRV